MPHLDTSSSLHVQDVGQPVARSKPTLVVADSWVDRPGLHVDRLALGVNRLSEAALQYQTGYRMRPLGGTAVAEISPLGIVGQFVRIDVPGTATYPWYGVVVAERLTRSGVVNDGGTNKHQARDQFLGAVGLEYFLDRRQIDAAWYHDTLRVARPVAFNAQDTTPLATARVKRGNRSSSVNGDGVYVFHPGQAGTGSVWTAAQIVQYLLQYFAPTDHNGDPSPCPFVLAEAAATQLASWRPTFDPSGLTVFEALNALLSPQRGFVWWVEYSENPAYGANGAAIVHAETIASTSVSLPGGGTLPANGRQYSLDFDTDASASGEVARDRSRRYGRVRARGARMTSTFTAGFPDGSLAIDWQAADETAYKAGASGMASLGSGDPAYASLSDDDKKKRNDAVRRQEKFWRVYSAFRIPLGWDQKSKDGLATSGRDWAFPVVSTGGSIVGQSGMQVNDLRVLPHTLLNRGWDYTSLPATSNTPSDTTPDRLPPLAIVQVAESPIRHHYVDKLGDADFAGGTVYPTTTSFHVHTLQESPGIYLRAANGCAHALAKDHWTGAEPTRKEPEVDYTKLRVTLSAEADTYAENAWPTTTITGLQEELVIDAGSSYRLDFLAAGTVVDVQNGVAVTTAGGILRDDRLALQDLAKLAYEWYQTDRAALRVEWRRVLTDLGLGVLVTTIGTGATQEAANTVIAAVEWDFLSHATRVETLGDVFDLRSVVA